MRFTGLTENVSLKPAGRDDAEREMLPENPLLVRVTIELVDIPRSVFRDCGLGEMLKSPLTVRGSHGLGATLLFASPL